MREYGWLRAAPAQVHPGAVRRRWCLPGRQPLHHSPCGCPAQQAFPIRQYAQRQPALRALSIAREVHSAHEQIEECFLHRGESWAGVNLLEEHEVG